MVSCRLVGVVWFGHGPDCGSGGEAFGEVLSAELDAL